MAAASVSGGQLHIVRCTITNENVAGESGIKFLPNSASQLTVTDTVIFNQGSGTGAGIRISPAAGGSVEVALKRVTVNGNAFVSLRWGPRRGHSLGV